MPIDLQDILACVFVAREETGYGLAKHWGEDGHDAWTIKVLENIDGGERKTT